MSDKKKDAHQTRRKFITGTVVGMAAGVSAAALGIGVKETKAETSGGKWFKETDIVVVGSGIGGCASALAAHEAGSKVLILEKAPEKFFGGNSSMSGGNFYAAPPEKYYKTLMKLSAGRSDETAARTVADHAETSVKWLNNAGIRMNWKRRKGYAVSPKKGKGNMEDMVKILQNKGIEVLFETKANQLLQDDKQNVTGVQAVSKSGLVNLKARKAVILATGGYLGNEEMMVRYIGSQAIGIVDKGWDHITGDGHRMARELGADLINMGDCRMAPGIPGSNVSLPGDSHGIIVNKECQRFIDEADASSLGRAIFNQTDAIGYAVLDEQWKTLVPASSQKRFTSRGGKFTEADTIEELAEKLGLNPIALKQTIAEFNAAVKDGKALGVRPPKTGDAVTLEKPKFYGTPLVNSASLSFGGVRINENAQVINLEGEVIPRLYAAGIVVGGIYYHNYKGGLGLASGAAFGKLAGTNGAAEQVLG